MPPVTLRDRVHEIIFEADTKVGRWFDVTLMVLIVLSVITVMLESVEEYDIKYHTLFVTLEWIFTIIFTIEYIFRLWVTRKPWNYALSFYGIIDLVAILPTYLSIFVGSGQALVVVRILRLMRVFRVFKLGKFLIEGDQLQKAIGKSRNKILVFLLAVILLVVIIGSVMYLIEGQGQQNNGFTSIPRSIYWAIVTLTTVGYGDITPQTNIGQFLSAVVMITGYAILAVPTGIVTTELIKGTRANFTNTQVCRFCCKEGHADDAVYCKFCGGKLNED